MKTPRGCTVEPCHGCGSTEVRRKGTVCSICRGTLVTAKRIADENQGRSGETVILYHPTVEYHLPSVYHDKRPDQGPSPVQFGFWQLANLVSQPTAEWPSHTKDNCVWGTGTGSRYTTFDKARVFEVATAKTLHDLHAAVRHAMIHAYEEGVERGRNLLMSLASGEITSDGFNETAARLAPQMTTDSEEPDEDNEL